MTKTAAACAAVAAVVAAVLLEVGPKGGDWAAHVYQRDLFLDNGLTLWNNHWYAGRYSFVTYSVLYYPLAAALGLRVLAVCSVALAAFAYASVVERQWGATARLSSYVFAPVWGSTVLAAAFPFSLGAALALTALAAFQRGRLIAFTTLAALTLAASPVAFVLLAALLLAVVAATDLRGASWHAWLPAFVVLGLGAVEFLVWRAFPDRGRYPFATADVVYVTGFCALGFLLSRDADRSRFLPRLFAVYFAVSAVAFAISSPLGGNVVRLRLAALPIGLLVVGLRGWRPWPVCTACIVLVGIWNLTPAVGSFTHDAAERTASASYWEPAVEAVQAEWKPGYRVHVVDTVGHWGAVHVPAAGFPIVRGWFRQHDFPDNALLYDHTSPDRYLAWLRRMGVSHVVLSDAPLDYSSRREGELLRTGRVRLTRMATTPNHVVYRVPGPRPIVSGDATVTIRSLDQDSLAAELDGPGRYRIAVHYSPYWAPSTGCVRPAPDGMMTLDVPAATTFTLDFRVSLSRIGAVVAGDRGTRCAQS